MTAFRADDNVVITGPGTIGLLALQLAKAAGANLNVIGTNQDFERLKLAKEFGSGDVINAQEVSNIVRNQNCRSTDANF